MRVWAARALIGLYPRKWRQRYGEELENLLRETRGGSLSAVADVIWSSVREWVEVLQGGEMRPTKLWSGFKGRPSAFVPVAMSLTALALVLVHVALYGYAHEADEGAVAHIWQILMAGQVPIIAFFALRWLPRRGREALIVLAEQALAMGASAALVLFLGL